MLKLSSQSQGDSGGAKSDHGDSEQPSVLFDYSDDDDGYERMDSLYSEMVNEAANEETSSELDLYLMKKLVPRNKNSLGLDYDVIGWWKHNSIKYPILSELAKDVLDIQVSFVASESAFSTSGRILDPIRSCLTPYIGEALICTQQWLKNNIQAEKTIKLGSNV